MPTPQKRGFHFPILSLICGLLGGIAAGLFEHAKFGFSNQPADGKTYVASIAAVATYTVVYFVTGGK